MADYTPLVDYSVKDALPTGNAAKKILGAEIDDELAAIATAIATKLNSNDTTVVKLTDAQTLTQKTISTDNNTLTVNEADIQDLFTTIAALASPAFTGTPTAPTPSPGDNSTKLATTAFLATALAAYATLVSPNFSGVPTVPTPPGGDSDSQIANTAWVQSELAALGTDVNVTTGTFTPTFTGFSSAPAGVTCRWTKFTPTTGSADSLVILRFNNVSGTSNATTFTVTNLPADITPPAIGGGGGSMMFTDNGTPNNEGRFSVNSVNVLTFFLDTVVGTSVQALSNGFTASGTKGFVGQSLIYGLVE